MLLLGDCNDWLKEIQDNSLDLIVTDPPYGIEFMGKDWDKALVHTDTWKECYRVLKQGKLAFVMCSPRQDVLSRMIVNLQDAGFRTNYSSIYWTYASGFPKAANVSKLIDKKNGRYFNLDFRYYLNEKRNQKNISIKQINEYLGYSTKGGNVAFDMLCSKKDNRYLLPTNEIYQKLKILLELDNRFDELIEREEAEREIIGQSKNKIHLENLGNAGYNQEWNLTKPATEEAKKMEGAYVGFQPKPAVEIILVVSKGKTLTWLDDVRIPYQSEDDKTAGWHKEDYGFGYREWSQRMGYDKVKKELERGEPPNEKGRFPANLLVSDDVLNDGKITKSSPTGYKNVIKFDPSKGWNNNSLKQLGGGYNDEGSYSRYFSLDSWAEKTLPNKIKDNNNKKTEIRTRIRKHYGSSEMGSVSAVDHYPDTRFPATTANVFPFLICPKASKSERNKGLEYIPDKIMPIFEKTRPTRVRPDAKQIGEYLRYWRNHNNMSVKESASHFLSKSGGVTGVIWNWENGEYIPTKDEWLKLKEILHFDDKHDKQMIDFEFIDVEKIQNVQDTKFPEVRRSYPEHLKNNHHPTVKPLKLMSYLITMGSREGDLVLDPFCGSGTVCIAADQLHRKWIGIERNPEYAEIIKKRLAVPLSQLKLTIY